VTNTRGDYQVSITAPGIGYAPGDQLTVSYTQVDPSGSAVNNLTITVVSVVSGGITGFTTAGSGIGNTAVFDLSDSLYTATNIWSFTVTVNGSLQRPFLDYTFAGTTITFVTVPATGAVIYVDSGSQGAYWQYVDQMQVAGIDANANLSNAISSYTSVNVVARFAAISTSGYVNQNIVANIFPALTNAVPTAYQSSLGSATLTSTIGSLNNELLGDGDLGKFEQIFSSAQALVSQTSPKAVAQRRGKKIADLLGRGGSQTAEADALAVGVKVRLELRQVVRARRLLLEELPLELVDLVQHVPPAVALDPPTLDSRLEELRSVEARRGVGKRQPAVCEAARVVHEPLVRENRLPRSLLRGRGVGLHAS
jgi:hypothetical protein